MERIGVIGLGFVGLPLAMMLADKGFPVTGFDLDAGKLGKLAIGISYITDISDSVLKEAIASGRFSATDDFGKLRQMDVIIICVPTPLTETGIPDLRFVENAGEEISKHLQMGQLVILESSTYPGTTREALLPILERSGLTAGIDFYLAYSPERIDPGNMEHPVDRIPKVLGGITTACRDRACELYGRIYHEVVPVSSAEVAEMSKLVENGYRFVNISFVNELAIICDRLRIDVWEVIQAARTKPYGYQPFYPGPGIGGHCIPVDPLYLQWKAGQHGLRSRFIDLSDAMNRDMVTYITDRTDQLLHPVPLSSARILLYGVTYKRNIADIRDSAAIPIMKELQLRGADVIYSDPYIPEISIGGSMLNSVELTGETLSAADCVIIFTDHAELPVQLMLDHAPLVFDTRHALYGRKGKGRVCHLGGGDLT